MNRPADNQEPPSAKMSIVEHLAELRRRIIISAIAFLVAFVLAYTFAEPILAILLAPIRKLLSKEASLAILKVQEAFVTQIKVAIMAAVIAAFPIIIQQAWAFVLPALKRKEAKAGLSLILSATLLFATGIVFAYFAVLPWAFVFFLKCAQDIASPTISLAYYINFCARMLLAFGVVFQLPLVIVFLVRSGIASIDQIAKARKYAVVIIFTVAAILTPPDVLTQILMAIPLWALFELSILAARLMRKKD